MFHSNKIYYFFFRYSHHIKVKSFLKYHEVLTSSLIFSQDTHSMILYENLRNISSKRRCLKIYEFNFRNKLILTDEFFEFVVHKYIREVKRTEFQVIHYHKMLVTISLFGKEGEDARYGNTGCGVFKWGYKIR